MPGAVPASMIDHTLLKADATAREVKKLCREAVRFGCCAVCVNPVHVKRAKQFLGKTGIKVCTVISFPLGAASSAVKVCETKDAVKNGADEIDMVISIGALKAGNDAAVLSEIKSVRKVSKGKILKVIIETGLLKDSEKVRAALLARKAGADFVKTSTGFGPSGATVRDVRLLRKTIGTTMRIKAAGGIQTREAALAMISAGADRIGTSKTVSILR